MRIVGLFLFLVELVRCEVFTIVFQYGRFGSAVQVSRG